MPRTTLDLDASVLRELKARGSRESKSLGQLASELLARSLAYREDSPDPPLEWTVQPMGARVNLADTEAVYQALDS